METTIQRTMSPIRKTTMESGSVGKLNETVHGHPFMFPMGLRATTFLDIPALSMVSTTSEMSL